MLFKLLILTSFLVSFNSLAELAFPVSGHTGHMYREDTRLIITKDGREIVDTSAWNLLTKGSRKIYTPRGKFKAFQGTLEIERDESNNIVGIKREYTSPGSKIKNQKYVFRTSIVEIINGVPKAYTQKSCDVVKKRINSLNQCAQLFQNLPPFEISKKELEAFPEFGKDFDPKYDKSNPYYNFNIMGNPFQSSVDDIYRFLTICAEIGEYVDIEKPSINPGQSSGSPVIQR